MLDIGNLSEWHRQDGSAPARTGPSCLIRVDPRKSASDMSFKLSNRSSNLWVRRSLFMILSVFL